MEREVDLRFVNKTNIVLIPKAKDPKSISQYRPISLCNVLYKIFSKTIANRLKRILSSLISEQQSAFVPKRQITDNALVAFEVFHYMKQKTRGKRGVCMIKLDIGKAYDRVEWLFLYRVMRKMGFDEAWVDWIFRCVSTTQLSFIINGKQRGTLTPYRGLR